NVLKPLTTYGVNVFVQADPLPGFNAGTLEVALVSPLGGGTVADDAGNPNTFAANLGPWPTTFAPLAGTFRTPRVLKGDEQLAVRVTGTIPVGRRVWIDSLTCKEPTQLYAGGPWLMVAAGSI